jgi:hypothetical protein
VKFLASPATNAPIANKVSAPNTNGLRPKICEKDAKLGWKTVDVRRKEVPDQKASMAVPWSFAAMMGRATERVVASRATANVTKARARKARRKRQLGLKAWALFSLLLLKGLSFPCGSWTAVSPFGGDMLDLVEGDRDFSVVASMIIVVVVNLKFIWSREIENKTWERRYIDRRANLYLHI